MDLRLTRVEFRSDGVFSELKAVIAGEIEVVAHTVEHAYEDNKPKIPDGKYTCVRGQHQLEHGGPFITFMVSNVPGHSNILLHQGNWGQIDSDGCILLGEGIAQSSQGQMVTQSKFAFDNFMKLQEGVDSFQLIVES